jgi:hypothetical protein
MLCFTELNSNCSLKLAADLAPPPCLLCII